MTCLRACVCLRVLSSCVRVCVCTCVSHHDELVELGHVLEFGVAVKEERRVVLGGELRLVQSL